MEIGQKVKVVRLRDRVPSEIASLLGKVGTIDGYKVLDGKGIGVVVKFESQFKTWFFEDEVQLVR